MPTALAVRSRESTAHNSHLHLARYEWSAETRELRESDKRALQPNRIERICAVQKTKMLSCESTTLAPEVQLESCRKRASVILIFTVLSGIRIVGR